MTERPAHEITQLLQAWRRGDEQALEELTPQVYRELHQAARSCMRSERDGHTLQATALINELYLRFSVFKEVDCRIAPTFLPSAHGRCGGSSPIMRVHVSHTNEEGALM